MRDSSRSVVVTASSGWPLLLLRRRVRTGERAEYCRHRVERLRRRVRPRLGERCRLVAQRLCERIVLRHCCLWSLANERLPHAREESSLHLRYSAGLAVHRCASQLPPCTIASGAKGGSPSISSAGVARQQHSALPEHQQKTRWNARSKPTMRCRTPAEPALHAGCSVSAACHYQRNSDVNPATTAVPKQSAPATPAQRRCGD